MITVQEAANVATAIEHGQKTVTSHGTRVALVATATALKHGVYVKALKDNTGKVYVGDSDVSASNGYELSADEGVFIRVLDLSAVYIDSSADGEGVSFIGT